MGLEAYDGMMMVIEAIKRSVGALTRDEIARQLHATRGYQGLQGCPSPSRITEKASPEPAWG